MEFTKQNSFSRSIINDAKMGAYFTDISHCKWISNFLEFPIDEMVCALEPSIGNAAAIKAVIEADRKENVKIFGVELNKETVNLVQNDPDVEKILHADFLNGIKVSHSVFSFCFSNPPYGTDEQSGRGVRLERSFLEKLTNYLKTDGVLVYIIPYSTFVDESFLKIWCSRYSTKGVYRFHDEEFKKFKQIVAFGVKKHGTGYFRTEYEKLLNSISRLEEVPILPPDYNGEKIIVKPSNAEQIEYFSEKDFSVDKAKKYLSRTPLYKVLAEKAEQKSYTSSELSSPPIKLKRDLMYLLAVSGGGQGLAGSEEHGDLHLQRGTVKVVETTGVEKRENSESFQERVKTSSSICMAIIENSGKITRFQ